MESIRKIIRIILRESLFNEEVIEETQTGQKDLEKLTNDVLRLIAHETMKEKAHLVWLTGNQQEPLTRIPMANTLMINEEGFSEIGEFVTSTNIRVVPTSTPIRSKESIKGELEYGPPNQFNEEFYKIWLKYSKEDLEEINQIFNKDGGEVTSNDIYFKLYYMFYSTLLHELQHAYDAWRSGGKAFSGQLNKNYISSQKKADMLRHTKSGYDEMTPEEIEAINKSSIDYLNLVHEINARYAQAMQKTSLTGMDFSTFDDIKKNWDDVYSAFRTNFVGWRHLSDKMKKKLVRRLAKAYQEESENLRTAKEKYPERDLEMVAENFFELRNVIRESIQELEKPKRIVGGVLVKCTTTDRVFLLLRNDSTPRWSLVSGTIEDGENVLSGLKREFYEELFINPHIVDFKFIRVEHIPEKNIEFHYYEGFVDKEFNPILDEENLDGKWFSLDQLPSPLYDGIPEKLGKIFKNPEVKEDKESDVFNESKEISDIDSKAKLSVFDFDSTLVNTPLPETGKQEWEQKTGTAWPGGWWGVEESLDTDVFDMTTNPEVISDYRREFSNPKNLVVMMTGRTGKLSNQVEKILSMNGLKFHDYLYNDGGETSADKIYKMEMILRYNPEIREIEMWDDRDSHIPTFQRWGENMISKGYLDNFNINHVK